MVLSLSSLDLLAQAGRPGWLVPKKTVAIQIDGLLQEWDAVVGPILKAGAPDVRAESIDQPDDVSVMAKAVWDDDNLYMAIEWKDNTWDIEQVPRQQAVWVTPRQQRRERMLFYDYLKLQINHPNFDYVLWTSPRISNRGPYAWSRLLAGPKRMDRAVASPVISARQQDGTATLEIQFPWRGELMTKPKPGVTLPIELLVADSDLPGKPLELKLERLKSLVWYGVIKLVE